MSPDVCQSSERESQILTNFRIPQLLFAQPGLVQVPEVHEDILLHNIDHNEPVVLVLIEELQFPSQPLIFAFIQNHRLLLLHAGNALFLVRADVHRLDFVRFAAADDRRVVAASFLHSGLFEVRRVQAWSKRRAYLEEAVPSSWRSSARK